MPATQTVMIFVYGTLREGASNHFRLEECELRGEAWVLGHLYPIDWYPALLLDDDGVPVRGEVYEVERDMLRKLDSFEGAEYERLRSPVHLKDGGEVEAWLYEYRGEVEGMRELVPADWLSHEESIEPGPPSVGCSMATFVLLPVTIGVGSLALWLEGSGLRWLEWLAAGLPLLPFFTGRWARKRREKWAEGAEICAAVAFIAFWLLLLIRYLPAAFEAFPN